MEQEEILSPHDERLSNQTVDSPRYVGLWDVELLAQGVFQLHSCSCWGKPGGDQWKYGAYCMIWHGWSVIADLDGYMDFKAGIGMLSCCYCIEQHSQNTHLYMSIPLVVALVQSYYPTCLVKRAWLSIYTKGKKVNSRAVEQLLAPHSLIPTQVSHFIRIFIGPNIVTIFSLRLSQDGFNYHTMMVVGFMHEIELGVWKNVLTHLLWIIQASGTQVESDFNSWQANKTLKLTPASHVIYFFTGFILSHSLDPQQCTASATMFQRWSIWQQETMKIFFKWVQSNIESMSWLFESWC